MNPQNEALREAASNGCAELALACLAGGADPNAKDRSGLTPLMLAAAANRPECAKILAPLAEPDLRNSQGETALMIACRLDHHACAEALLPFCDPYLANPEGLDSPALCVCFDSAGALLALANHAELGTDAAFQSYRNALETSLSMQNGACSMILKAAIDKHEILSLLPPRTPRPRVLRD